MNARNEIHPPNLMDGFITAAKNQAAAAGHTDTDIYPAVCAVLRDTDGAPTTRDAATITITAAWAAT